jgi:putative PIN family toxin of toxin-antitoxin system
MRVVVDTNIFVSAALKESSWPGAVVRWLDEFGGLLKSSATEAQLMAVLDRPYFSPRLSPIYLTNLQRILAKAEFVTIVERVAACRDPTDDKFLELAVNGRADVIVTGDVDLLVLGPFRDIPVISPVAFLRRTLS